MILVNKGFICVVLLSCGVTNELGRFSLIDNEQITGPKVLHERSCESKTQCSLSCVGEQHCIAAMYDKETKICSLVQDYEGRQPTNDGTVLLLRIPNCPFQDAEPNLYRGPIGVQAGYDSVSHREYFLSYGCITAIRSWTRKLPNYFLSGIQMRYGTVWAPVIGYSGDDKIIRESFLEHGEYITWMKWWGGGDADLLEFFTNTGRSLGEHGSNPEDDRNIHDFESGLMYLDGKKNSNHGKDTVVDLHLYYMES